MYFLFVPMCLSIGTDWQLSEHACDAKTSQVCSVHSVIFKSLLFYKTVKHALKHKPVLNLFPIFLTQLL